MATTTPKTATPAAAKAGLVFPGLGHLLTGDDINGLGLMSYMLILLWALAGGWGRFGSLLFPEAVDGGFQIHPWVALITMFVTAGLSWFVAYRKVFPAPFDPEQDRNSQWREINKQFRRNKTGVFGLHLVNVLLLTAFVTPFIAPYHPDAIDVGGQLLSPRWGYLMGTDEFGRDIFSRVMYGARISLSIGFISVSISATTASGASIPTLSRPRTRR